ncbi:hypothetical protein Bbelb_050990 [Branchiostoma belcheri]|nr:hypothetical protein Bbelb_050990 [Branchiostoma belcheri]
MKVKRAALAEDKRKECEEKKYDEFLVSDDLSDESENEAVSSSDSEMSDEVTIEVGINISSDSDTSADVGQDEVFCTYQYGPGFTIHGMYDGRPIPFAMALMTTKTVGAYRQVLQHVKEKGPAANGTSAVGIVSDVELALITAHKTEFPDATVSGCYFHFCQSLWRRIQNLGLAGSYIQARHTC